MAENKIKVNELQTATPQLSDTLLASGAEREYACRISDLKDAIGGGGGGGDWNANEGEEGYIANRTHWVENKSSFTATFNLTQEDIEDEFVENAPFAEEVINMFRGVIATNLNIIINNQIYKGNVVVDISNNNGILIEKIDIENREEFMMIDFYEEDGTYGIMFDSSLFVVGENTITIPTDTIHKINSNYIEDTLLWQRGHGIGAVQSLRCMATGDYSYSEGYMTASTGEASHAEGSGTTASGEMSHAEGGSTTASGAHSHAEGDNTTASKEDSHAEGYVTTASAQYSHAEGYRTTASGESSHAEGNETTASGKFSHAEGSGTTASGRYSHAEGSGTTANHASQHVFGEHNIADPSTNVADQRGNYVEIVGNGTNNVNRSNARTLDWSGNEEIAGTFLANGGILLKSPDGSTFTLKVGNDGTLTVTKNT